MENSLFLKRHKSGAKNCIQDKRVDATTIWSGHMIDKLKTLDLRSFLRLLMLLKLYKKQCLWDLRLIPMKMTRKMLLNPMWLSLKIKLRRINPELKHRWRFWYFMKLSYDEMDFLYLYTGCPVKKTSWFLAHNFTLRPARNNFLVSFERKRFNAWPFK